MIVHCATCNASTILREGQDTCSWCGTKPNLSTPVPGHPRAGACFKIREPDVLEARRLYDSGLSLRQVAATIHPRTDYASVKSCTQGLLDQFVIRDWPRRDRVAATMAANDRRSGRLPNEDRLALRRRKRAEREGTQPMCGGVVQSWGKRRGQPCGHKAMRGSDFCIAHSPDRDTQRRTILEKARAAVAA